MGQMCLSKTEYVKYLKMLVNRKNYKKSYKIYHSKQTNEHKSVETKNPEIIHEAETAYLRQEEKETPLNQKPRNNESEGGEDNVKFTKA